MCYNNFGGRGFSDRDGRWWWGFFVFLCNLFDVGIDNPADNAIQFATGVTLFGFLDDDHDVTLTKSELAFGLCFVIERSANAGSGVGGW